MANPSQWTAPLIASPQRDPSDAADVGYGASANLPGQVHLVLTSIRQEKPGNRIMYSRGLSHQFRVCIPCGLQRRPRCKGNSSSHVHIKCQLHQTLFEKLCAVAHKTVTQDLMHRTCPPGQMHHLNKRNLICLMHHLRKGHSIRPLS